MAFNANRKEDVHFRINHQIRVPQVRLVGEGIEQGVYETRKALEMAQGMALDLVEISPNNNPPVCRIVDYAKFKYDQKKKQKEMKAKQQKVVVKEIRFGPNTDDHDFNFKLKHAHNFLKEGSKVKAYVHFVGRSIVFKERGEILLKSFVAALEDVSKLDEAPRLEGKRMFIMLSPKAQQTGGTPKKITDTPE